VHGALAFTLYCVVNTYLHIDGLTANDCNARFKLATTPVKQLHKLAGLHAQYLYVPTGLARQRERYTRV
jgi:hypothetical protein